MRVGISTESARILETLAMRDSSSTAKDEKSLRCLLETKELALCLAGHDFLTGCAGSSATNRVFGIGDTRFL